jgi:hypothetical protein
MAIKPRNLALNASIGVAVAALIIAGIFASGIRFPTARTGTLLVFLTDAPVKLQELNVTIDSFAVHSVEEGWIELPVSIDLAEPFNLLDLQNGVTKELAQNQMSGEYNKLRLTVGSANATFNDEVVPLIVPPGHIDVIIRFEVENGETTVLLVDMEVDLAAISQSNHLRPVLKVEVVGETLETPAPPPLDA